MRRLALAAFAPLALAACEPTWQGSAPVTRAQASDARCAGTVRVYPGDTVFSLARRCNVSVREVIEANDLKPPYVLTSGQVLRMPGGGSEYVVQRGDTLLGVARKLKVDFQILARTNGKSAPYVIQVGEKLRVPGTYQGAPQVARNDVNPGSTGALVIKSPNTPAGRKAAKAKGPPPLPPPEPVAAPTETAESRHPAFQPQQALPPAPPPLAGKGFIWPLRGEMVAEYGPLAKGQHNDGINIAAAKGTPVRAAENGVVAYAGNELKGFGNLLLIKHADGWMTAYAHNDQLLVSKGDSVKRGQQISTVGATGNVTSPQLHFEIRRGTEAVNPMDHLGRDPAISNLIDRHPGLDPGS
ncbi:MAG TPA: LysM peptidoglycan-binding domain-containing M23 family metallopeptidase, partial [Candidatus Omnitrophota bacterium]|nr:LysM peptidoglycan-binding domain-containing M23 family metallopeptidase [Candidatus Omnitrophota bacterium]